MSTNSTTRRNRAIHNNNNDAHNTHTASNTRQNNNTNHTTTNHNNSTTNTNHNNNTNNTNNSNNHNIQASSNTTTILRSTHNHNPPIRRIPRFPTGQSVNSPHDTHVKTTKLTTKTLSLWPIMTTLFTFRSLSAIFSPINDGDEVFNYIEPLHNLYYGTGLQTWKYSPSNAFRSYTFLLLHSPFAILSYITGLESTYGKVGTYMLTRLLLGMFSTLCQAKLIRSVGLFFGEKSARLFLFLMLFAPGFTHSPHSILPQGFCMNILALIYSYWLESITTSTISPQYNKLATSDIYNRHQRYFVQNDSFSPNEPPTMGQIQQLISNTGTSLSVPPTPSLSHLIIAVLPFLSLPTQPNTTDSNPSLLNNRDNRENVRLATGHDLESPARVIERYERNFANTPQSSEHQLYMAELQAVRNWSRMIQLITITVLIGWPFTLIFLIPIILSFLDCYFHFSTMVSYIWCGVREFIITTTFTYILPFNACKKMFSTGSIHHPQWLVDTFFYQTKAIFASFNPTFMTSATLTTARSNNLSDTSSSSSSSSQNNISIMNNWTTFHKRMTIFTFLAAFTIFFGIFITTIGAIIDRIHYNRWTLSFLNIAIYNFNGDSTDSSQGQQLNGTEPPSYYIYNLILNFNIAIIFVTVFLIIAVVMIGLTIFLGKYRLTHLLLSMFPVVSDLHPGVYTLAPPLPNTNTASLPYSLEHTDSTDNISTLGYSNAEANNFVMGATTTTNPSTTTTTATINDTKNYYHDNENNNENNLEQNQLSTSPTFNLHQRPYYLRHPPLFYRLYATLSRLHQQLIVLTPAMVWFLAMMVQPHKEERLLYIIYPSICLAATFGLEFVIDIVSYLYALFHQHLNNNATKVKNVQNPSSPSTKLPTMTKTSRKLSNPFNLPLLPISNDTSLGDEHGLECQCCTVDYPHNYIINLIDQSPSSLSTQPNPPNHANASTTTTTTTAATTNTHVEFTNVRLGENDTTPPPLLVSLFSLFSLPGPHFFAAIRTSLHYLFHIPTSSLTSLRYASHAHPVRKPYRPYSGIIYTLVFHVTLAYMILSVCRNLAVIYGYSAPGLTLFKLYANINADEVNIPLFKTDDDGVVVSSNIFSTKIASRPTTTATFHARNISDQVEMLFNAGANRYKPLLESYTLPDEFIGWSRNKVAKNNNNITTTTTTTNTTHVHTAGTNNNQHSDKPSSSISNITSPSSAHTSSIDNVPHRYIHPCFIRHLQEYYYINQQISTGKLSTMYHSYLSSQDNNHPHGNTQSTVHSNLQTPLPTYLTYFPSRLAECMATYKGSINMIGNLTNTRVPTATKSTHSQYGSFSPTQMTLYDRLPLNVNNHLGSQPLNYQLYSLIQGSNGGFFPVHNSSTSHIIPTVPIMPQELHNPQFMGLGPNIGKINIKHKKINSFNNPYDDINIMQTPLIPLFEYPQTKRNYTKMDNSTRQTPLLGKTLKHFEIKRIVEESTTIKVCMGNDWFRFPSSFFLPGARWMNIDGFKEILSDLPHDFVPIFTHQNDNNNNINNTNSDTPFTKSMNQTDIEMTDEELKSITLTNFLKMYNKHIPGSGVGTIVGDEILLRPRFEVEYLPRFDFDGMLPQHFTSKVVNNPSSQWPIPYDGDGGDDDVDDDKSNNINKNRNNHKNNENTDTFSPTGRTFVNLQTSQPVPNFNNLNQRDMTRFIPALEWCDYIFDTDLSARHEKTDRNRKDHRHFDVIKEELYRKSFELISSMPLIDPERSPSTSRSFYFYGRWTDKNKFVPFNLWARKQHVGKK